MFHGRFLGGNLIRSLQVIVQGHQRATEGAPLSAIALKNGKLDLNGIKELAARRL